MILEKLIVETGKELFLTYNHSDVTLLADIFENTFETCMKIIKLTYSFYLYLVTVGKQH